MMGQEGLLGWGAMIVSLVILCNASQINLFIFYVYLSNISRLVVYVL